MTEGNQMEEAEEGGEGDSTEKKNEEYSLH